MSFINYRLGNNCFVNMWLSNESLCLGCGWDSFSLYSQIFTLYARPSRLHTKMIIIMRSICFVNMNLFSVVDISIPVIYFRSTTIGTTTVFLLCIRVRVLTQNKIQENVKIQKNIWVCQKYNVNSWSYPESRPILVALHNKLILLCRLSNHSFVCVLCRNDVSVCEPTRILYRNKFVGFWPSDGSFSSYDDKKHLRRETFCFPR